MGNFRSDPSAGIKPSKGFCENMASVDVTDVDILGVSYSRVLVHGPAGTERPAEWLVVRGSAEGLLDDWILQPSGLSDGDAAGTDASSQRLGS